MELIDYGKTLKELREWLLLSPGYPESNLDLERWGYDDYAIIGNVGDAEAMLGLPPDCLEMDKSQIVFDTSDLEWPKSSIYTPLGCVYMVG